MYSNGMVNGVSLDDDGFGDYQDGVFIETRAVAVSESGNEPQVVCYQEGGLNYIKIRYDGSFRYWQPGHISEQQCSNP